MYEDVKTYLAAIEAAQVEYDATTATLGTDVMHTDSGDCPACQALALTVDERRLASLTLREADRAAWNALLASSHPLVAWIAKNCLDRKYHAGIILKALPASMDDLNGIAEREGWCYEWNELRDRADAAGVLPQDAEVSA